MTSIQTQQKKYRPEIDGLRALSVIGVVLYHAGLGFSGGFVGVDVFFVISGFLITGIISKEISEGRFTLTNFWVRRIRRIIPAMAFMLMALFPAAVAFLDASTLVRFSQTSIAQSFMISNISFWRKIGYFNESSELKVLLHTWSLSIEEQFYLFLPLLLLILCKVGLRKYVLPILVTVFVLSLSLNVWATEQYASTSFFLLPTRAWELLAGSLLALLANRIHVRNVFRELLSALGIAGILVAMFAFNAHTPFPGKAALLPVVGASLYIFANTAGLTKVGQVLACRPMVYVGLISYSLYLWHWPFFAFARNCLISVSLGQSILLVIVSFVAAHLSWRFVETPFRKRVFLKTKRSAFIFAASTVFCVVSLNLYIMKNDGLPSRFDAKMQVLQKDMGGGGAEFANSGLMPTPIGASEQRGGVDDARVPDFVLWGDSHAMMCTGLVNEIAARLNLKGVAMLSTGTAPVPGLWKPYKDSYLKDRDLSINQLRFDQIIESGIKQVILIARWNAMIEGYDTVEIEENPKLSYLETLVTDLDGHLPMPDDSALALERRLSKLLDQFEDHGVTVWLLRQVP